MGQCRSRSLPDYDDSDHFDYAYTITSTLGAGGFGTVYSAVHHRTGQKVAVKKVPRRSVLHLESLDEVPVPREVKLLAGIRHPGIVHLLDFYSLPRHFLMVLEFLPEWVDLFDYSVQVRYLSEEATRIMMRQLFTTLHYLHSELQIAHLDVKPENILVEPTSLAIKLIDFGAASPITGSTLSSFEGTRQYASPDILFRGKFQPVDADIWAAGVTLYRLVVGRLPFQNPEDYYSQLVFPARNPTVSVFCQHIIHLMLCRQSDMRPATTLELLNTPWMMQS